MQDADDHTSPGYLSPWFANGGFFLLISPMDHAFSSRIIYWKVKVVCSTNVFFPLTSMKKAVFVIMVPMICLEPIQKHSDVSGSSCHLFKIKYLKGIRWRRGVGLVCKDQKEQVSCEATQEVGLILCNFTAAETRDFKGNGIHTGRQT